MLELFFVACLQTSPGACQERSILYQEDIGLMGCMLQAQPQLAEWSESNPGVTIKRWSCRYAGDGPDEA
jgi:hypothetical protein